MSENFQIRKVRCIVPTTTSGLWLVDVDGVPVAQIEKMANVPGEMHPFKVFSCNSQGTRTHTHDMVVFYPEDGGWDAAVKHALSYAK